MNGALKFEPFFIIFDYTRNDGYVSSNTKWLF